MNLRGRTALVTGAARRLGRATASLLAARGARLAVHYRASQADADALVGEIRAAGGEALAFAANLADPLAVHALADTVEASFGPVDVLVNNAAVFSPTPIETLGEREWDETLAVNLKAPYLLALRLGRHMRDRGEGKIVNVADAAAFRPFASYVPYCVSKAGLISLTQGLAKAFAPTVQINCVAPGAILPPEGASAEAQARIIARTPLARFGHPADVAAAVLFLLEGSDFVTGSTLTIDGGRSLS